MKYFNILTFIVLFVFSAHAQNTYNSYSQLWSQIEEADNNGLVKTALELVTVLEQKAITEQNNPQAIKALLYKSKYILILEEHAQLHIITDFKNRISETTSPTKNLLQNMLASLYWQYFQQNRWLYYERTHLLQKGNETDFRTWDSQTMLNEIQLQYQLSLTNKQVLQNTPISNFEAILYAQPNATQFRPTLYDLLANTALKFYETAENSMHQPSYKFEINTPQLLQPAAIFMTNPLTTTDSLSLQFKALKIYQERLLFHAKNNHTLAFADADIARLKYVKNHATFPDADTYFLETLQNARLAITTEAAGLYAFEIAKLWHEQGWEYQPDTNNNVQWQLKKAYELCQDVKRDFPDSFAAKKCEALQQQIKQPSLSVKAAANIPTHKTTKILVTHKEITQVHFKIFRLTETNYHLFKSLSDTDKQAAFINGLPLSKSWQTTLLNEGDYQLHSSEISVPPLQNGRYVLVATAKKPQDIITHKLIQVSNIAVVNKTEPNQQIFQFIDRTNGQPIANLQVTLTYSTDFSGKTKKKSFITNSKGHIFIPKTKTNWRNIEITASSKTEKASFGTFYISSEHQTPQNIASSESFLFTDRSIYRLGQTVYFKGIVIQTSNGASAVIPHKETQAVLYNTHSEEISRLTLKTNQFGSVTGQFTLPNSGLAGTFRITLEMNNSNLKQGHTYFSVEDYKRPKFKTIFNPVSETYQVNDSVTVTGTALAFGGSPITNARVEYRVYRKVQFPNWQNWYRPAYSYKQQEITNGKISTNESGNFDITFKAIPDSSIDKKTRPVFNYEIIANVTDINGETQSSTATVNVGYHAMMATISVANKLNKTSKNEPISIDTRNLNGVFVPATGKIKIYKLQAPKQVLRNRPWPAPDYKTLPETEFKNLFPYEAYSNEADLNLWPKGALVFETNFNTKISKTIALEELKTWRTGAYKIVLESTDAFGQTVTTTAKTTVFSPTARKVADNQLFTITTNKNAYQPDDTVLLTIGSAAKKLNVTIDIEKNGVLIQTYIIKLKNNKKTIKIPVTKADYGGFAVKYSYAFANSFESGTELISVPYPKTALQIETSTFRDKLQPGTNETWAFKIKGPQGEKVAAEILASMYDASLDEFKPHKWTFNPLETPLYYSKTSISAYYSFNITSSQGVTKNHFDFKIPQQPHVFINWFGLNLMTGYGFTQNNLELAPPEEILDSEPLMSSRSTLAVEDNSEKQLNTNSTTETTVENSAALPDVVVRKHLQENAFFFPQLQTDSTGSISFNFTSPEALTSWKLQLLAHTKSLESNVKTLEAVTQKELMVIPNVPRFLRQGDTIRLQTKIANLTKTKLSGQAQLLLTDAITGKDITAKLLLAAQGQTAGSETFFEVEANNNTQVSWLLHIPKTAGAIQYKIVAKSGTYSDGEQAILPVLSNRLLVTETLPIWANTNQTQTFVLNKLRHHKSSSLKHHKLTLELTTNPAWYAVQALPYLIEYPYESNEQTFSRYYANALARNLINSNPRIREVFNQWQHSNALVSDLEKNTALKNILLQETPWLRDAQTETEQKKRMALLFDVNKTTSDLNNTLSKLKQNQMPSGAWPWFSGGRDNRFMTQNIIAGFGQLYNLKVIDSTNEAFQVIKQALTYLDAEFIEYYKALAKTNKNPNVDTNHLSYIQLHYLYTRSFFPEIIKGKELMQITDYYLNQIEKYWLSQSLYAKGLMALISERMKKPETAKKILLSLKETSITHPEMGMYWKENTASWLWHQAPIETQALLIEVFTTLGEKIQTQTQNNSDINKLKVWLLKQKQTTHWSSTKATVNAVYALLLQGNNWVLNNNQATVLIGPKNTTAKTLEIPKTEAGTGYYKTTWDALEIEPEMATVTITKSGTGMAWGALYWQYFEDLDKITTAKTPLQISKKLYKKIYSDTGEALTELTAKTPLKVGDLVRVRITIQSDRNMEFIHMKDMRAAGLEPVNVLSSYKWKHGLGYYESTKDASTNFFFDYLPKGIYIFEYDLRVNNAGHMSNGITTIQSMYAPEFTSHSKGNRILAH
ncbi:alpha-2-macroglobulin [Bizionia sediminis]|uniref:Alpha-2-macroglobulin n=1 Tax=Bizionia sediminis TaxID=1737064 RepID=A0ABW5KVC8_9FLAO